MRYTFESPLDWSSLDIGDFFCFCSYFRGEGEVCGGCEGHGRCWGARTWLAMLGTDAISFALVENKNLDNKNIDLM